MTPASRRRGAARRRRAPCKPRTPRCRSRTWCRSSRAYRAAPRALACRRGHPLPAVCRSGETRSWLAPRNRFTQRLARIARRAVADPVADLLVECHLIERRQLTTRAGLPCPSYEMVGCHVLLEHRERTPAVRPGFAEHFAQLGTRQPEPRHLHLRGRHAPARLSIGVEPRRRVRDWTVLRRVARRAIQRRNTLAVDTALHGWIVRALRVALQRSVRHVAVDATRMQEHTLDLREGLEAGAAVRADGRVCGLEPADGIGCQGHERERQAARHIPTECFGARAHANPSFGLAIAAAGKKGARTGSGGGRAKLASRCLILQIGVANTFWLLHALRYVGP